MALSFPPRTSDQPQTPVRIRHLILHAQVGFSPSPVPVRELTDLSKLPSASPFHIYFLHINSACRDLPSRERLLSLITFGLRCVPGRSTTTTMHPSITWFPVLSVLASGGSVGGGSGRFHFVPNNLQSSPPLSLRSTKHFTSLAEVDYRCRPDSVVPSLVVHAMPCPR